MSLEKYKNDYEKAWKKLRKFQKSTGTGIYDHLGEEDQQRCCFLANEFIRKREIYHNQKDC